MMLKSDYPDKQTTGIIQIVGAVVAFIWAFGHSPYGGTNALFTGWVIREEYFLFIAAYLIFVVIQGARNIMKARAPH